MMYDNIIKERGHFCQCFLVVFGVARVNSARILEDNRVMS